LFQKCKAGDDPKVSDRRPPTRNSGTMRAFVGLRGWPRRSCDTSGCSPTQRTVAAFCSSQLRRPATLLPLSRLWLRVGAENRAGGPGWEIEPSLPDRPRPHRASV